MRKTLLPLIPCLILAAAPETKDPAKTKPAPSQATKAFPFPIHQKTLPNGLKIVVIPTGLPNLVSIQIPVSTGSRNEVEPGKSGFAHFFEHMMFHGSKRFPGPVYDSIVNGMGAKANAFTTDDFTAYHLDITQADLARVIEIEADRFQNLDYDESGFKTESGAVYGEYRKGRTSPFEVLGESVQDTAFDKHTYKHTTIGFEADIRRMPQQYEYSKTFFARFYRPENVVLVVTGDFDKRATLDLIQKNYATWKSGYKAPKIVAEPEQTAERRIDVPFEGKTLPILSLNFKGERLLPQDRTMIAAKLIGELAFGETSAAYKELVLEDQRVDALFADFGDTRDPSLWSVIAKVKEAPDLSSVERRLWSAIQELVDQQVSSARLDSARSRLKYSFLSHLSTPGNVNESIARIIAITGDIAAVDQIYATLDQITPEDVQRAAAKYLTHQRATVAILHSKSGEAVVAGVGSEKPVLMPVPADPNVAFKIAFHVGSQDDPAGKEGLAALVGAMISEGGTQKNSYAEVLEKLFPLAGSYSANVDKELTVVSGTVHHDKLAPFYALLMQALVTPGFRQDDFERLRDNAVSDIETSLRFSSDEELGKATLQGRVFANTPYAHLTEGSVESLKSITLDDVKNFWRTHFTRENLLLGIAGSYPDSLPASMQADLTRLPSGVVTPPPAPTPAAILGRSVTIVEKPAAEKKPGDAEKTTSAAISFGYTIPLKRGTRDYYALWIANSWLGEHRNSASHLYQVIREARGMNYGDYSYIEAYPNGGRRTMPPTGVGRRGQMFEVWIRPVPREQTLFALRAGLREVELLSKNGLTAEQFEATRSFLAKYSLHFAETTAERLGYALDDRYFGVKEGDLALFRKMMKEITLDEVNAAVKKYLQVENVAIAIVSDHAKELRDAIVADGPSPMSYGDNQKPKEVLEQDKLIESYPLRIPAERATIIPVTEMFAGKQKPNG